MNKNFIFLILLIFILPACGGRGCSCTSQEEQEPQTTVASKTMTLLQKERREEAAPQPNANSRIRRIVIGPSETPKESEEQTPKRLPPGSEPPIPEGAEVSTNLTDKLKKKMTEAFAGEEWKVPNVKIYLSSKTLDEFVSYYESMGYKIQKVTVPATEVIGPVLEQRPDLREVISLSDYEGIQINQVMVEGLNVSAADKYIDPETYDIVNKTFITSMPVR